MKLLVADIGGTNARFGYQENNKSEIKHIEFLNCIDFTNIGNAIAHYVSKNRLNIENLSLSIAGPCGDNFVKFTNNHWSFDKRDLLNETNCNSLLAINDFAAQGLGFTNFFSNYSNFLDKKILDQHELTLLNHGKPLDGTNVLITGPGTGLGVGTLVFIDNIHNYFCFKENHTSEMSSADQIGLAAKEGNILARNAARLMVEIFATSIANNILVTGSQKCVIICGGISAKLSEVFNDSMFHDRLRNKGKYKNYVSDVPILLSFDENNGLKGSAEAFYSPFFQRQKVSI